MAHIDTGGKGGRNKSVEPNLVPFIDLMSVLITFLLISAVWTQVSMIQLGASFASPRDENQTEIKPPPLEDVVLRLDIIDAGYRLLLGKETKMIPKTADGYDKESLLAHLARAKQMYPDKANVKMQISDQIQYEHVVAAMDIGLKAGFAPELLTGDVK